MNEFDWKKHKNLLNPETEDQYSKNTHQEVYDKVGKHLKSFYIRSNPDETFQKITEDLIKYRERVLEDDELSFLDRSQSKVLHGTMTNGSSG